MCHSLWFHTYSDVIFDITTQFYCSLFTKPSAIILEEDITTTFCVENCQRNSEICSHVESAIKTTTPFEPRPDCDIIND